MFMDKQAELATTVAFDLDAVRPGPGQPIKMFANLNAAGDLVITTGATSAAAGDLITVACDGITEFELPSTTERYIKATFAGDVGVVMDAQTAK